LGKTPGPIARGFFTQPIAEAIDRGIELGRHNALDKLAEALATEGIAGETGAIVLTSRVSVEMVQKTYGNWIAHILVAISAPSALAVRSAEACGITLVGIARGSAFEIFCHPEGMRRTLDHAAGALCLD
jgi:FdhD protein